MLATIKWLDNSCHGWVREDPKHVDLGVLPSMYTPHNLLSYVPVMNSGVSPSNTAADLTITTKKTC